MLCVGASLFFISISQTSNPNLFFFRPNSTPSHSHSHKQRHLQLKHSKSHVVKSSNTSYEVGGGYSLEELNRNDRAHNQSSEDTDTSAQREALLKGGDQVISVLQEMITLVSCFYYFIFLTEVVSIINKSLLQIIVEEYV